MSAAFLVSALSFGAVTLAIWGIALGVATRGRQIGTRFDRFVARVEKDAHEAGEIREAAIRRVAGPMAERLTAWVDRHTSEGSRQTLRHRLEQAGWLTDGRIQVIDFLALRALLTLIVPGLTLCLLGGQALWAWFVALLAGRWVGVGGPLSTAFLLAAVIAILGYVGPELALASAIRKRQQAIRKRLPDALDLLTVCVEAGLGFDAALTKVVAKMRGPLADEFGRMLQEMRLGKLRRHALRDLGDRVEVEEVSVFVAALIQADQLGVSIGRVLRIQSEQARLKRRQKAEEQAMKAPIKMLFPLIFFIFPAIFVVLMGPAAIQIMEAFTKVR